MKIIAHGDTLTVSEIQELVASTSGSLKSELSAVLGDSIRQIELDLSQTTFVDCGGLAALVAIRKVAKGLGSATVCLLNPPKTLQRMVSMMNMSGLFPIQMTQTMGAAVV